MNIKAAISKRIKKLSLYKKFLIIKTHQNHKSAISKLKKRDKINVAFFLINLSQWKYEKLYFLLKADKRFNPVVFICPFTLYTEEIMMKELENSYKYLKGKGYKVIKTIDETGKFIDVKKDFKPDLVFFTSSWLHTNKIYFIYNFLDTLTIYVPYAYNSSSIHKKNYNRPIHNLTWKFFVESNLHKRWAEENSNNKGKNIIVSGYPGLDLLVDPTYSPKDYWKPQKRKKKRIIWAPHHTIPGHQDIEFSNFLEYAHFMLSIAKKYKESLQFVFKPHPNLKGKLYEDINWGKDKTDMYYNKWKELPNGQLEEGDYIDLFLTSDAMIHDSRSFITEYLATQKPVMFLMKDDSVKRSTNRIGLEAFEKMYVGKKEEDIIHFIEEIIILGNDKMEKDRVQFFNAYLKSPKNKLASENIYEHIKTQVS